MEIVYNNVYFKYNNSNKEILNNINLKLKDNSINFIVGPNGSGKTTLIQMLNGILVPIKGYISIDEYKVCKKNKDYKKLRFDVGVVFQFPENQIFNLTVEEEIGFALNYYNYRLDDKEKHIMDALKMVDLDETYLKRNPLSLSSGEMRKVAIASILAFNPKVIVLDEPTLGLDSKSKNSLIKIIRILKNRFHKTIVIVSHDMELVHKLGDYIYVLDNGKVIKEGNKYDIFTDDDFLKREHISMPNVIKFSKMVKSSKNIKLGYRDDINDLLKDIYRYAR